MIYQSLIDRAREFSSRALCRLPDADRWLADLPGRRQAFRGMLGLPDDAAKTDPHFTRTGVLERDDYIVEKVHFQPIPKAYVAANIYRPRQVTGRLPAVIYVCGHSDRAKFHYQPHGRWFGRHGYVCMVIDHIWAGESGGFHHGVYNNNWWHWYSQGYSPAGVEVWAAIRAADYLQTRDDVDGDRLGITGNSGGGSMSWFSAAADERFKVAAPSCQTGNAYQHIVDRTVDTHCDCTWWINTRGWDLADVAALIAPRALLVAATSGDVHWRPYAYHDLVGRVGRVYRLLGAGDNIALAEDAGRHGYTPKTRLAIFNWFARHLKADAAPVTEDIDDRDDADEDLAVYPAGKRPVDDRMGEIDRIFIPSPSLPEVADRPDWQRHQAAALAAMKETSFRQIPADRSVGHVEARSQGAHEQWAFSSFDFDAEPHLRIRAHLGAPLAAGDGHPLIVAPLSADARTPTSGHGAGLEGTDPARSSCGAVEVRGTGRTSIGPGLEWTLRRAYPLLGRTLPERQVLDLLTGLSVLREQTRPGKTALFGKGQSAPLSIYAMLLDESVDALVLADPLMTHWDRGPEFLSILKVGDLPHNLALAFPRPILFVGSVPDACRWAAELYRACGAADRIAVIDDISQWVDHV